MRALLVALCLLSGCYSLDLRDVEQGWTTAKVGPQKVRARVWSMDRVVFHLTESPLYQSVRVFQRGRWVRAYCAGVTKAGGWVYGSAELDLELPARALDKPI